MHEPEFDDLVEWIEPFDPPRLPPYLLKLAAAACFGVALGMALSLPA